MKTKCIVLGESQPSKELKKIEFVKSLNTGYFGSPLAAPSDWINIELIRPTSERELAIMFAYDNDRKSGVLYLGHWNDGVA